MKEKKTVIIERAEDGTFACYLPDEFETFGLAGYGKTVEEAKADFWQTYDDIKEIEESEGREMPTFSVVYKYDMQSFFDYFNFLNITRIAEHAGINASLLRQYSKGISKAGEKQYKKLNDAMTKVAEELSMATISC